MNPPRYLVAASIEEKRRVEATIMAIAEEGLLLLIPSMIAQLRDHFPWTAPSCSAGQHIMRGCPTTAALMRHCGSNWHLGAGCSPGSGCWRGRRTTGNIQH